MALAPLLLTIFFHAVDRAAIPAHAQNGDGRQASPFVLPIVRRDSLLNGLQLITLEQPGTGAVRMHLRINSGAMFDLAGKGGLADMTAAMLLKGGGGWTAKTIAETIEQNSLSINVSVGWDSTDFIISGPLDALDTIFELLNHIIVTPAFDQKELDALKAERAARIRSESADDRVAVERKAIEAVFGSHPFGRPARGTAESIGQITRQDLLYYFNRFYIANNSELVVSGDVTADRITRLARAKLGAWKKGERVPATFRPPDAASNRRVIILDRPQASATIAAIAQQSFSRRADDYFAAMIMSDLLAQTASKSVPQGASIETRIEPRYLPGLMLVEIKSPADNMAASISVTLEAFSRMQSTQPAVADLEAAKSRMLSLMTERLKTNEGATDVILDIELYGLGRDYLINYADRLNSVTPADVQRAAQAYLKPQAVVIVTAAPAAKCEESLKKIGAVTVVK